MRSDKCPLCRGGREKNESVLWFVKAGAMSHTLGGRDWVEVGLEGVGDGVCDAEKEGDRSDGVLD